MRLYQFLVWLFRGISRLLGVKISGRENIPAEGAVVVIANHRCWVDIILMALAAHPRRVHFMAKSEYGNIKLLNWLIYHLGSFTVERGESDIKAIKTALGYLKQGEVVGIFPEGTRNRTDEPLLPFKEGAFMIAARGKAQVVPMAFFDAKRYLKFGKPNPQVLVGEAMDLDGFVNEKGRPDALAASNEAKHRLEKMLQIKQEL